MPRRLPAQTRFATGVTIEESANHPNDSNEPNDPNDSNDPNEKWVQLS